MAELASLQKQRAGSPSQKSEVKIDSMGWGVPTTSVLVEEDIKHRARNVLMERRAQLVAGGHLVRSRAPSSMGSLVSRGLRIFSAGGQFRQRLVASPERCARECGRFRDPFCRHHFCGDRRLSKIHGKGL